MAPRIQWLAAALGALAAFGLPATALADPPAPVRASRGSPVVDGALDEPAWAAAPWTRAFTQREPDQGAPGAHRTRARVLYDDDALYVAVECETDRQPDARLGRRDVIPAGESVRVLIDARGEGSSAFQFETNPAGVQADAIVSGDNDADAAWDTVWDVETSVDARGWRAEFRIPWRALRFDAAAPEIRVQIERGDFTASETVALVPIPTGSPRPISGFAPLAGVRGVRAARVFELRPYVSERLRLLANPSLLDRAPLGRPVLSFGADLKVGITNDLVLDATVLPDFGQVEVDPAVVNLSTFEVFFPERRPFFLEGSDIFRTPLTILHTRRIGQAPGASPTADGRELEWVDQGAPIWGAARVTGRIGPISVGVLEAITGPVFARERFSDRAGQSQSNEFRVRPETSWLAARVRGPIARGSNLGAMVTHVGRFGQPNDVVGSIDWDWRAPDGVHRLTGQFAASTAWNGANQRTGQALYLEASRAEDRSITWQLRVRAYSRDFNPNGMGYLDRADLVRAVLDVTLRTPRPVGAFRSAYFNPWVIRAVNTAGVVLENTVGFDTGFTGQNRWSLGAGAELSSARFDDRETRGRLPYALAPSMSAWAWIDSDPRGAVRGGISCGLYNQNGGWRATLSASATWVPLAGVALSVGSNARVVTNMPRWVGEQTDAGSVVHSVFGQQRAVIFDTTMRASLAFTRRVTLDVFSQLLVGTVRYEGFTELVTPESLVPYAWSGADSYDRASLTVNAIGRWEYRTGAFLSLVFLHRQSLSAYEGADGFGAGLGVLGFARPDSTVLAKLTYLLM